MTNLKEYDLKLYEAINRELKGLKKINKTASFDLTTRMKHIITSVNGDFENNRRQAWVCLFNA